MSKINYDKQFKNAILGGSTNNTNVEADWVNWNNQSGENVQGFIKNKLENTVVDFSYENSILYGKNAFGKKVCSAEVNVVKPTYKFEGLSIKNVTINGSLVLGSVVDINANSGLTGSLYLDWDLVQEVGNMTNHNAGNLVNYTVYATAKGSTDTIGEPISGVGQWSKGKDENGSDDGLFIDLKPLFNSIEESAEIVLNARVEMAFTLESGELATISATDQFTTVINAKRIVLRANQNNELVRSKTINFSITGLESTEGFQFLWGGIDSTTVKSINLTSSSSFNLNLSDYIKSNTQQINLVARIKNTSGTLYSDWINVDVLYLDSEYINASGANVMITSIPNSVSNCDSATLFKVLTTAYLSGKITIYAFKTNTLNTTFSNINANSNSTQYYYKLPKYDEYLFQTVTMDLSTAEDTTSKECFTYLELDTVTSNTSVYLAFVIEPENGIPFVYKTYKGDNNSVKSQGYFQIQITQPANYSELQRTKDQMVIDYSQINLSKTFFLDGNEMALFESSNLNPGIDSTDGIVNDGRYTGFKVSPLGIELASEQASPYEISDKESEPVITEEDGQGGIISTSVRPINLFNSPIKLNLSNNTYLTKKGKFSIELLIKTYNVNDDDDFILGMGNIRLYPHYLRVWDSSLGLTDLGTRNISSNFIASCANFSKDEITHIVITYDNAYKPSTYEKLIYNDLYKDYSTAAGTYPCLKVYINGTINRCVSVLATALEDRNGKFDLQIHPSNSNINIYGFRTYEKCLSAEEIKKNKISSIDTLANKSAYYNANDITYSRSDYDSTRWNELQELGLSDTISIRKILNIPDKYNAAGLKKSFSPKNAMLLVVGEEGPLYYGNKKFTDLEGRSIKTHDAALFVKYANYPESNGKFIGLYMAHENGYDEYYKSQGSSAKRYGGSYNVLFAKFHFIPDAIQTHFAKLVKGEYYDEQFATENPIESGVKVEEVAGATGTTYKTNVNIDFLSDDFDNYMLKWETGEGESSPSYHDHEVCYPSTWNDAFTKLGVLSEYYLPTEDTKQIGDKISKSAVTKLVGKVNYASSMQSHKQGACDLYAINYPNQAEDYMYRRAVKEDVFYYFYISAKDCKNYSEFLPQDGKMDSKHFDLFLRAVTWDDIDFDHVKFFGFQTWGSAKMDPSTFGMNKKTDLEYLVVEGADNKNACTNFKSPWASMQIWEEATATAANPYYSVIQGSSDLSYIHQQSGLDASGNPDYTTGLMINDETIMYKKPSEEEIKSGEDAVEKGPDAWDIAGNALKEGETLSFSWKGWGKTYDDYDNTGKVIQGTRKKITPSKKSISTFAEFANLIYTFDFGNLELLPTDASELKATSEFENLVVSTSKKYIVTSDIDRFDTDKGTLSVHVGDVLRWDQLVESFVPAGLYYNVPVAGDMSYNIKNWQTMNVGDVYYEILLAVQGGESIYKNLLDGARANILEYINNYSSTKNIFKIDSNYDVLTKEGATDLKFINNSFDVNDLAVIDNLETAFQLLRGAFADMFKCVIWKYCDPNSFTYHQAAIRFLSGTDNRAKNIYFVIQGEAYKKMTGYRRTSETPNADGSYPVESFEYYVLETNDSKKHTSPSRNLITLFLDDLDTIFATDNNGQLSKDYNLVEPIYNNETITNWGDSRSGLWYNFDLVFEDQIKYHTGRIVDWAINGRSIISKDNNLYKSFLTIQNDIIPSVGYNHASEIYYDVMQTVWEDDKFTTYGQTLSKQFSKFNNNQVPNPISLVHGGCYESESQFLKKRIALLATYTGSAFESDGENTIIKPNVDSAGGDASSLTLVMKDISYVLDIYPRLVNVTINDHYRPYADPFIELYGMPSYLYALARQNDKYSANVDLTSSITATDVIDHTDYVKTITFNSGISSVSQFGLNNASEIRYEIPKDALGEEINMTDGAKGINFVKSSSQDSLTYMDKIVKNVEILDAPYSKFTTKVVDFSKCQRITSLNLAHSTTSDGRFSQILLPKSNKLSKVILPSDVDNVVIEYYPKIQDFNGTDAYFKFDSQNVSLKYVTIDFRNPWALRFLSTYAKTGVQNVIFTNLPEIIEVDYDTLSRLCELPNFTFGANAKVKVDRMDLSLKKKLAKVWGNIDDSTFNSGNAVYVMYPVVKTAKIQFPGTIEIEKVGTNVQYNGLPYVRVTNPFVFNITDNSDNDANDVQIDRNSLNIVYEFTTQISKEGQPVNIVLESNTGDVLIPADLSIQGLSGTVKIQVKVSGVYTPFSNTSEVSFGAYEPKPGDIAYSDGTFASFYNKFKTPIGFVWWAKEIKGKADTKTLDIRIMANESISGYQFGPSNSTSDYWEGATIANAKKVLAQSLEAAQQTYLKGNYQSGVDANDLHSSLFDNVSLGSGSMQVTPPSSVEITTAIPAATVESNLYCGKYFTGSVYNIVSTQLISHINKSSEAFLIQSIHEDSFDSLLSLLNTTYGLGASSVAWPAYMKTYWFLPNSTSELHESLKKGNWYIPSAMEYSYLISLRIKLLKGGNAVGYEQLWRKAANDAEGNGFYDTSGNLYSSKNQNSENGGKGNVFENLMRNYNLNTANDYNQFAINISFLDQLSGLKSSTLYVNCLILDGNSGNNNNNAYSYWTYSPTYNSVYTAAWSTGASYYVQYAPLDLPLLYSAATVYPCCRIIKEYTI